MSLPGPLNAEQREHAFEWYRDQFENALMDRLVMRANRYTPEWTDHSYIDDNGDFVAEPYVIRNRGILELYCLSSFGFRVEIRGESRHLPGHTFSIRLRPGSLEDSDLAASLREHMEAKGRDQDLGDPS